ncbi:adenylate/guanylate cyclase domain-containing protein (plasmid) [Methylobacterium phyllosphaerae]
MISADEDGTLRRLKALRREVVDPRIAAARGRIVKSTGDGVLVEFPSPVRAVTCAVAIQRAAALHNAGLPEAQALHMRIGINVGDVVAEPDGDLYGDGVNVAARLEPLAEPGGLCISRSVHDQVRDRLPYRFEDKGKLELKNIARPVGVFALTATAIQDLAEPATEDEPATLSPGPAVATAIPIARQRRLARAAIPAIFAAVALGWWSWPWSVRAPSNQVSGDATIAVRAGLPAKPVPGLSLVVLPFSNLSNDPEQEFFADGLTEDLTTDLSHLSGSFVIARNTAFTYKSKTVDLRQLGRDLGVRYALEGSVRRVGERIVLNAQLISTETGAHLWADRFEGERSRLGELQFEFLARLARSLDVQLIQAESLRSLRERPDNPDAADLAMRGWAALNRPRSPQNTAEARDYFERALAIDPSAPHAKVGLARALAQQVNTRASRDMEADTRRADELARQALALLSNDGMAHYTLGEVLRAQKRFDEALNESKIASSTTPT